MAEKRIKTTKPSKVTLNLVTESFLLSSFPEGTVLEGSQCELSKAAGTKKAIHLDTDTLAFVATNHGRNAEKFDSCRWLVGVYEPGEGSVSVHPVGHVFPMRSTIKGYAPSNPAESTSDASSARERRALLFEDFGASKKKRALAASAANQVKLRAGQRGRGLLHFTYLMRGFYLG